MASRGPEAAGTWSAGATGASHLDNLAGVGRRSERSVPIPGDYMRMESFSPDGRVMGAPAAAELRKLARGAVQAGLLSERRGLGLDGEVRQLVRQTCAVARANGTLVEHLLILLKEAWREQPEARPRRYSDAEDTLARMITLCIDEYYAPPRSS